MTNVPLVFMSGGLVSVLRMKILAYFLKLCSFFHGIIKCIFSFLNLLKNSCSVYGKEITLQTCVGSAFNIDINGDSD